MKELDIIQNLLIVGIIFGTVFAILLIYLAACIWSEVKYLSKKWEKVNEDITQTKAPKPNTRTMWGD